MKIDDWKNKFKDKSFFYVTPDVKRGLGLEEVLPGYHIICAYHDPLIPILRKQQAKIFRIKEKINNSAKLLENSEVINYIKRNTKGEPQIILFKPSVKAELVCAEKGFRLLVNSSQLNKQFEDKILFYQLIKKFFPKFTVPSIVGILKSLNFKYIVGYFSLPFIVQFAQGWAGKTTFVIRKEQEFNDLVKRFPETFVKISQFIDGFTVLNNACIYDRKILISPPAFQLNGFEQLYTNPNVTCGREWPVRYLSDKQGKIINELTKKIGKIMESYGFKGFFGLDFMVDKKNGRVFVSENNARFTASTAFWTKLELGERVIPLMLYHLAEFTGLSLNSSYPIDSRISGAQIIFRDQDKQPRFSQRIEFGVLKSNNEKWQPVRRKYRPEKLAFDEIIYMERIERGSNESELSRIECRREVTKTPDRLCSWVRDLLRS